MSEIYAKYISAIERTTKMSPSDYGAVRLALQMAIADTEAGKGGTFVAEHDQEMAEVRNCLAERDLAIAAMQKAIFEKDTEIALLNKRIEKLRTDLVQQQQTVNSGTITVERRTGRPSYTLDERAALRHQIVEAIRTMLAAGKTPSQKEFERHNPTLPRTNALVMTLNCKWSELVTEAGGVPLLSIRDRVSRASSRTENQEAQPANGASFRG